MKRALYNAVFTVVTCAISALAVTFARAQWGPLYEENKKGARNVAVVEAFGLAEDLGDDFPRAKTIKRDHVIETTKKGITTFKATKDGKLLGHAIQFEGPGYEGPMHGILASGPEKQKVLGFRIHHQEETPGLGSRLAEPEFVKQFNGKTIVGPDGERLLRIVRHPKSPNEIAYVTGATMTSKALDRILASTITEFVSGEKMVAVAISVPKPGYSGAAPVPAESTAEALKGTKRPAFMAPEGTKLLSRGKPVSSDEEEPLMGELKQITDGKKEATEEGCVELGFGLQYVQIDLGATYEVRGLVIWHDHRKPLVYKDVIVQVSDDAEFTESVENVENVKTVFNNDQDNSSELGAGKDLESIETHEGMLIKCKGATPRGGAKGRYVRAYANGNFVDEINRYTEIEVYGRAVSGGGEGEAVVNGLGGAE